MAELFIILVKLFQWLAVPIWYCQLALLGFFLIMAMLDARGSK
jgi:hypothetical protein